MFQLIKYIKAIRLQLFVVFIIIIFYILEYYNLILPEKELERILVGYLNSYGIPLLFFISFFENLIGINVYFPGSVAILFGMTNTAGNPKLAFYTFISIFIGSLLSNLINVAIGKRLNLGEKLTRLPSIGNLLLSLWHPHFASVSALTIGKLNKPYISYMKYFIPISFLWNLFWGLFMYFIGLLSNETMGFMNTIFYIYIIFWIVFDVYKEFKKNRTQLNKTYNDTDTNKR